MPKETRPVKHLEMLKQLPPEIANSPLLARKKLTNSQLAKYVQDVVRLFTPETVSTMMAALLAEFRKGNVKALELALRMYGLVATPGGVNVITNIQQLAAGGINQGDGLSFDAIARRLDEARRERAIEASATVTEVERK